MHKKILTLCFFCIAVSLFALEEKSELMWSTQFRLDWRMWMVVRGEVRVSPRNENPFAMNGFMIKATEDGSPNAPKDYTDAWTQGWIGPDFMWNTYQFAAASSFFEFDGRYFLNNGKGDKASPFAHAWIEVLNNPNKKLHYGVLEKDETWEAGEGIENVIVCNVRIPSGVTVTIADGAEMRFCENTRIIVEDGAAIVDASDALKDYADNIVYLGEGGGDDPPDDPEEWEAILDSDGNAHILKYNGNAQNVVVPTELNGHAVVEIKKNAFEDSGATIESITIPHDVKIDKADIIADCPNLKEVNFEATKLVAGFGDNVKVNVIGIGGGGQPGGDVNVVLTPGWNLVSLPAGTPTQDTVAIITELLGSIYYFDKNTASFGKINAINELQPGVPYWIFSKNDCTLVFKAD